jgi:SRSO17 transposase
VSGKGRAFVDRRLYLPKTWTDDPRRCHTAAVPDDFAFATKPALARDMIEESWQAGARFRWVAGDEVYGADPALRGWLQDHDLGYVLAVACDHQVTTAGGRFRVDTLAGMVPDHAWETYAAADGSKGPRLYDWALIDTVDMVEKTSRPCQVLVRRSRDDKQELAFFLAYSPKPVPLAVFVTVAGRRWGVEECFQSGKNEVGLDHYQVRLYHAWYRHITLAMLAHAWLAVTAVDSHQKQVDPPPERTTTAVGYRVEPDGLPIAPPPEIDRQTMIPLTLNELRHLFAIFHPADHLRRLAIRWSNWRRRHQARARYYHYRRRIRAAQASATPIETTMQPLLL